MQFLLRIVSWRLKWLYGMSLLTTALASVPSLEAADGKRVAFVVGIGAYDNLAADKQLKNAVNDADGVATKLGEIGFQVSKAPNLTRSAFNKMWQDTLNSLTKDDTFVLYFSGHGVQIDGHNYLLPRDIPYIEYGRDEQLKREAISLNELLADLSTGDRPHPQSSVAILDACRDNPLIPPGYKSAATAKGLAGLPESDGIFVMYAAASNRTALDRLSPNDPAKHSVFTRTLLPLMGRPDLSIQELSNELKDQVWKLAKSAGREQRPTYYDGIVGRLCLPGCVAKAVKEPVGGNETPTTAVVRPSLPQEATDKVKVDSPPAPQSRQSAQQLAIKPNGSLPKVQPTEKLPLAITGRDGAPMVLVPAGDFWMGSADGEGDADEHPRHHVHLDAFYLDQYEVTTSLYATFFQETKRALPKYWSGQVLKQHGRKPVVGVNWNDATAYCSWAGKRLPTEAEWEKSARGTDQRLYPWGNALPRHVLANFNKCCDFKDYGASTNVGSKQGKSPYSAHDLAGNVGEWVADWYDEIYYRASQEPNPTGPSSGKDRIIRGGSWIDGEAYVRSANRYWASPSSDLNDWIGFRCAQDAPK